MGTHEFLERLYGGKPDNLYILVWTIPDKRSYWCQTVEIAEKVIANLKGQQKDVYVGIGLAPRAGSSQERTKAEEIAGLVAVWADVDFESPVHPGKKLPKDLEEALEILPKRLPPTFVILTGHGAQFWWALKEPEVFENDTERERAHKVMKRWQSLLCLNAAGYPHSWQLDRLADLARIARVPGTWNHKETGKPKPVEIHGAYDFAYNLSDFENYLDLLGIPAEEKVPQPNHDSIRSQVATSGLRINLHATIDPDWIELWISADPQFARTWRKERPEFPSQSEYDMALCHFSVRIGLDHQKIIDLSVQHRRMHGGKHRHKLGWYIDNIRKAEIYHQQFLENIQLLNPPAPEPDQSGPNPDQPSGTAGTAGPLAIVNERLKLKARITRIVKITGRVPSYRIEFGNGSSLRFATIEAILEEKSFRFAIAGHLNQVIPHFLPRHWIPVTAAMLQALVEISGGIELEEISSSQEHLAEYLENIPLIKDPAKEPRQRIFWPIIHYDRIAVHAGNFTQYLKTRNADITLKEVIADLVSVGAERTTITPTGLRKQTRWLLPAADFPADKVAQNAASLNEETNNEPEEKIQ
ncbi:MAG TPA: hypothetical protein VH157_06885 [Bryobacteraceae bacterium]|jgi:hypothetical protein|nr:hypothetical protein [Bryobacteraceae bacterium]